MTAPPGPPGPSDAELVARVLGADREAFAVVYDRYGPRLYDFAYSMLRHAEDAADAVADSFVLFAERLPQLREPDRLRPWLYAIVRTECLRRLKARKRVSYGDDEQLMAMADDAKTPDEEAESTALRQLVWDAAAGLADRDRALLDLHLRQGLEGAELGEAMGVTAANAYVMVNRLKAQVDRSLGALLIARMGREDCDELDDLLVDWDGTYSPLIRKRVARHIEGCEICGERRKKMVSPWMLFAAVPVFTAPLALRDRVLEDTRLVAYTGPGADAAPGQAAAAAGSTVLPSSRRGRAVIAAAVLVAVVIIGAIVLWPSSDADPAPAASPTTAPTASLPTSAPTLTAAPPAATAPVPAPTGSETISPSPTPTQSPSAAAPGRFVLSTRSLDLGTSTTLKSFRITNTGGRPLSFEVAENADWLVAAGTPDPVAPGRSADISVGAARTLLDEGNSTGQVRVSWSGGGATVRVSVRQENPPAVGRPRVAADPSCNVPVSVTVSDQSALSSVVLRWSGPSGSGSATMHRSGSSWSATAGQFSIGGNVSFHVVAEDARGNARTGPTLTTQVNPCPG